MARSEVRQGTEANQPTVSRHCRRGNPSLSTMPASVDSLESVCSSEASYESDTEEQNRLVEQQDWDESVEQLRQLVSIVLLPFLGKWLGRRWSYWGA